MLSNLTGKIGYNYIYTGKDTANQFKNKINWLFEYQKDKITASLNGIYINKLYANANKTDRLPDLTKFDLKCKYSINQIFNFIFEIDNLLDEKYSLSYDDGKGTTPNHFPEPIWSPGISLMAGIQASF